MIKSILSFLAVLLVWPPVIYAAGGPDIYGYTWKTSADPGGPPVNWIDVSLFGGTLVTGLADDNSSALIDIGFPFHYYWSDFTQVKIGSNGWVSFNDISNIASCFPAIPTGGGVADNYLAPFMADLTFNGVGNPGEVYTWTNNSADIFIIMFKNVPYWSNTGPGWTGSNSFEIILKASDSSVQFRYENLSAFNNSQICNNDVEVGIEAPIGDIGLQVYSDMMPPSNFSLEFNPPSVVSLILPDITPVWNQNIQNSGVFIPSGYFNLVSNIKSAGNANVTAATTVTGKIKDLASQLLFSDQYSIGSLNAGDDSTFVFPSTPRISMAGEYFFETGVSNSQDINPGNNLRNSEIQIVDPCNNTMTLAYTDANAPDGAILWSMGANSGGGIFIKPPLYPVTITQVETYPVIFNGNAEDLIVMIYANDGPGGVPGTLLYSGNIVNPVPNQWNIHLITPVTIDSAGFYIGIMQTGTETGTGTVSSGPKSGHAFEIMAGQWVPYRDNLFKELMIRCQVSGYPQTHTAAFTSTHNGTSFVFENHTAGSHLSVWDFGDGTTDTSFHATHTYATDGAYNVCLISSNGCDVDTFCQTSITCLENNLFDEDILIYPNPTTGDFICKGHLPYFATLNIEITDILSRKLVQKQNITAGGDFSFPFSLSGYPAGMYLLTMYSEKGRETFRIVLH